MKKKNVWQVISCLIMVALLLTSCATAPPEEEVSPAEEEIVAEEEGVVAGDEAETTMQHIERGVALLLEEEYEQATIEFNKAIELNPNESSAYLYRGISYGERGEYDKAIADFTEAIELNPNSKQTYYNRGFVYERKGEYDRAIADYSQSIELDPAYALAYAHRASAYKAQGMEAQAIADLEKCIEVSEDHLLTKKAIQILAELLILVPVLSAECEISKLFVNYPRALELGEEATIKITVLNHDEIEGIYNATLTINGEPIETREILVPSQKGSIAGSTEALFHVTPDELGTYEVEVGGKTGTFWVLNEIELTDALSRGLVRANASGSGLQSVTLELESVTTEPLGIVVPALTLFRAISSEVQDMLAIMPEYSYAVLESIGSKKVLDIPVVCANMNLRMPEEADTFRIEGPSLSEDLVKLHQETEFHWASVRVEQFAIWVITDNPSRSGFVALRSAEPKATGPSGEEIEEMREIFEAADIDTAKYRIFQ